MEYIEELKEENEKIEDIKDKIEVKFMTNIEKVDNYLAEAGMFFLASIAGDKPKCRPLGLHILHEDKIYFGVGDFKEVYQQLNENPNIEIVASKGEDILRYYGIAKFEENEEVLEKA